MKEEYVRRNVSGLRWAGGTWWIAERKVVDTIRETTLLSVSLVLVLFKIMKAAPPVSGVEAQNRSDGSPRANGERQSAGAQKQLT